LAEELKRFLNGEPITARPPTAAYRLQKLVRRHRAASVAAALIALTVVIGGVVSSWALVRERSARRTAAERLDAALLFVDQVLTNVVPGIGNLTGASLVQQNLGQATLHFAQRLRLGAGGHSTVRGTLARALLGLASAQNPGGENTIGDYKNGLALAQEAVRLLDEQGPQWSEPEQLKLLLNARIAVILCHFGLGQWDEGVTQSRQVELLFDQIEQMSHRSLWIDRQRWNVRANLGYSLLLAGHLNEAVKQFQSVLSSAWSLGIGIDSDRDEQEVLANTHANLAVAQGLRNDFDAMLTNATAGHRFWTNLAVHHPGNARYQVGRIEGRSLLGWAYTSMGRTNDGLSLLRETRIECDHMVQRDPANDPFRVSLAITTMTRALAFAVWGTDETASTAERRDRLKQAEDEMIEAEKFGRIAKSKEAEARLALARAGMERMRSRSRRD